MSGFWNKHDAPSDKKKGNFVNHPIKVVNQWMLYLYYIFYGINEVHVHVSTFIMKICTLFNTYMYKYLYIYIPLLKGVRKGGKRMVCATLRHL